MQVDEAEASLPALSIDESGSVSALIVAIDEAVEAQRDLEQQLRAELDVNNTDLRALLLIFRLCRRGLAVHPGDLVRGLGISSGAGSQVIARLRRAGLVERAQDSHDARSGVLTLSREAADRLAAATRRVRSDLDRIIDSLGVEEEQRLLELLHEVRDTFRSHAHRAQPA